MPVGHYYSPIPDLEGIRERDAAIFVAPPRDLPDVDLNEEGQLTLLTRIASYYGELPFPESRSPERRYYFENPNYSYSDAIFLYGMLRHLSPRRFIEVGSGHSSCAALDTDELFLGGSTVFTFIEPDPALLLSLIRPEDVPRVTLLPRRLQEVPTSTFEALEANDVLFVDSTHVVKIDNDVNHVLFRILPALKPGVTIHFHDVFYPFEYPRHWVYEGRAWNEGYALRAFLAHNSAFEIVLFNTFLETFHEPFFAANMPLCLKNPGGSLWIRKR